MLLSLNLGPIELIDHAFVHRIHESADACRLGVALLSDVYPDVGTRLAKARTVVDLIGAFMQLFARFYNLKFHSHRQISLAADCRQFPGYTFARFLPCRFDPNQFLALWTLPNSGEKQSREFGSRSSMRVLSPGTIKSTAVRETKMPLRREI